MCGTLCALAILLAALPSVNPASAPIERVWLTHRTNDPRALVVNWESAKPGASVVRYGRTRNLDRTARVDGHAIHQHVEIPLPRRGNTNYRVETGDQRSPLGSFQAYPEGELCVAVVGVWQGKPNRDAELQYA
ncbi:MAG: hypothetical protein KY468_19760, partial [Armatimonadetes bacterium]|nr:hypothetical protein [Armatimonadota bacterium]